MIVQKSTNALAVQCCTGCTANTEPVSLGKYPVWWNSCGCCLSTSCMCWGTLQTGAYVLAKTQVWPWLLTGTSYFLTAGLCQVAWEWSLHLWTFLTHVFFYGTEHCTVRAPWKQPALLAGGGSSSEKVKVSTDLPLVCKRHWRALWKDRGV